MREWNWLIAGRQAQDQSRIGINFMGANYGLIIGDKFMCLAQRLFYFSNKRIEPAYNPHYFHQKDIDGVPLLYVHLFMRENMLEFFMCYIQLVLINEYIFPK